MNAYSALPRNRPGVEELKDMLREASRSFSCAHVVIDAMNEHGPSDADRARLVSMLHDLQKTSNFKILVTARDVPSVSNLFQNSQRSEIRATDEDLKTYLRGRLSDSPNFVKSNITLQDELVTAVVHSTDGM